MSKLAVASFNCWSGSLTDSNPSPLDYICDNASQHDVLSLQEVHWSASAAYPRYQEATHPGSRVGPIDTQLGNEIYERLYPTHHIRFISHFESTVHDCEPSDTGLQYGNMMLIKKSHQLDYYSSNPIHGNGNLNTEVRSTGEGMPGCRQAQWVTITVSKTPITILNVHGLWSKFGKVNLTHRTKQSGAIVGNTISHQKLSKVSPVPHVLITGDLNYTSELHAFNELVGSRRLFPDGGVNLNWQFAITDTRTSWYKKDIREADFMICGQWLANHCTLLSTDKNSPSDHTLLSADFILD